MHSAEHLSRVGDSFHGPTEDVQRELQPLQDLTARTVQTQALQCLKTHTNTRVSFKAYFRSTVCLLPYLQSLSASGQLQLDVLLSQVAVVLLRLQPLLQGVLITAEGQGDLTEGSLRARTKKIYFITFQMFMFCLVLWYIMVSEEWMSLPPNLSLTSRHCQKTRRLKA